MDLFHFISFRPQKTEMSNMFIAMGLECYENIIPLLILQNPKRVNDHRPILAEATVAVPAESAEKSGEGRFGGLRNFYLEPPSTLGCLLLVFEY